MTDSKLITLLKALTKEEFTQFEKFIDSPYHNKGRDLTPFLKVLKAFYPEFNSKNLNNEFIFKKLFPEKQFDIVLSDNLIRNLSSHLFRLCKEYLVQIELESQIIKKKYFLLNQLRRKKIYKEFDKEYSIIDELYNDNNKGSIGYFVDKHLISAVKRDCSLDRDDFNTSFEFTIQASENICVAALISAFKFEDEKNHSWGYNLEIRENLIEPILNNLDEEGFMKKLSTFHSEQYPYLQIFYGIYLMNSKNDEKEYFKVKELMKKYSSLFGQSENYVLWNIMLTYCAKKGLSRHEIFELHNHMLDNNMHKLSPSENFHIVLFRNMVMVSAGLKQYQWLEEFIKKYSPELHEFHIDNMKVYSMAHLCYSKSEFENALEYILKIKLNLFMYKFDVKILQSKIYYELGYHEEGLSLISATLTYLNESKELSRHIRTLVGNFVKCLRELIKIRLKGKNNAIELHNLNLAAKEIDNESLSLWITQKIEELKTQVSQF